MCFCVNWFFGKGIIYLALMNLISKWVLLEHWWILIYILGCFNHCSPPYCNAPNILLMCAVQPISQGVSFQLRHHSREDGLMELCQWMPGHRDSHQQSVIMHQTRRHRWLRMRLVLVLGLVGSSGFLLFCIFVGVIRNGGKKDWKAINDMIYCCSSLLWSL